MPRPPVHLEIVRLLQSTPLGPVDFFDRQTLVEAKDLADDLGPDLGIDELASYLDAAIQTYVELLERHGTDPGQARADAVGEVLARLREDLARAESERERDDA